MRGVCILGSFSGVRICLTDVCKGGAWSKQDFLDGRYIVSTVCVFSRF